jgi:hypothetical protein
MKFQFLDRERDIKFSLKDRDALREKYTSQDEAGNARANITLEQLPELLLVGLRRDDAALTAEQLPDLIDLETLPELYLATYRALGFREPDQPARPTAESLASGGDSPASTSDSPTNNSGI